MALFWVNKNYIMLVIKQTFMTNRLNLHYALAIKYCRFELRPVLLSYFGIA